LKEDEMAEQTVAVIGTFDTKAPEYAYLRQELARHGLDELVVDISCLERPAGVDVDYSCVEVARRAGRDFDDVSRLDKIEAGRVMVEGATSILQERHAAGALQGLIALGGANGSAMACRIMQAFPIGLPKLVVSVMAAGDPRQNAGIRDIILINSVTDMCLNALTRQIMANAVAAMAGMLRQGIEVPQRTAALQVGASMLGLTSGVLEAQALLESQGAEVLVFHANGIGGAALEDLIAAGEVDVALDLTTNEVGNHLLGGVFDAGPHRLEAAGARGIPQVVAPGAVDFVNFWGQSVPNRFRERDFIFHNVQNTLMRTNAQENERLGRLFAEKLNRSRGRVVVLLPLHGFSGNDRAGGPRGVKMSGEPGAPWHDPAADRAFVAGLKAVADPRVIDIQELEAHINDPAFMRAAVAALDHYEGV
jgi:uncharacterized protein (UPF0261 family)